MFNLTVNAFNSVMAYSGETIYNVSRNSLPSFPLSALVIEGSQNVINCIVEQIPCEYYTLAKTVSVASLGAATIVIFWNSCNKKESPSPKSLTSDSNNLPNTVKKTLDQPENVTQEKTVTKKEKPLTKEEMMEKADKLMSLELDISALDHYNRILQFFPEESLASVKKSAILIRLGKEKEAEACIECILKSWKSKNDFNPSLDLLNLVLEFHPEHPQTLGYKCWALDQLGKIDESYVIFELLLGKLSELAEQGKKQECISLCLSLQSLLDKNITALFGLGEQLEKQQAYESALSCYDNILKENPSNLDALVKKGILHKKQGENQKFKECFNQIFHLGVSTAKDKSYLKIDAYHKALNIFNKALLLEPENLDILNNIAFCERKIEGREIDSIFGGILINPTHFH